MRALSIAALAAAAFTISVAGQANPFLGKWNLTGTGDAAGYVYWLEIKEDAGQLTGMFLNRGGSPTRLAVVKVQLVGHPERAFPVSESSSKLQLRPHV